MNEYYLFLDESKPIGVITYFCLAGCIISKDEYINEIIPKVNSLKSKIFGKTDIILHESDIRNYKGDFACIYDKDIRKNFWDGVFDIFESSNIKIIGACVSNKISKFYYNSKNTNSDCNIALQIVLENFVYFLEKNNAKGRVVIESTTSDEQLRILYHTIVSSGTLFLKRNVFQKYLIDVNFYGKLDNNIGLQVADFVPNPLNRKMSGLKKKPYSLLKIFEEKLYDGSVNAKERFGLKIIE